jgi:hypothetical protein
MTIEDEGIVPAPRWLLQYPASRPLGGGVWLVWEPLLYGNRVATANAQGQLEQYDYPAGWTSVNLVVQAMCHWPNVPPGWARHRVPGGEWERPGGGNDARPVQFANGYDPDAK